MKSTAPELALGELKQIGEVIKMQDNWGTADPMFCVQIKVRDIGYDAAYSDNRCWFDSANEHIIYDDDADFKEPEGEQWDLFGYRDRWETVMVCFTEKGCQQYLDLNGHNDRRRAFRGEVRIFAESFYRSPEMLTVRQRLQDITLLEI